MSSYFGWLVEFVEDKKSILCHLFTSGLLSVPLEIATPDGTTKDTAALVAECLVLHSTKTMFLLFNHIKAGH